MKKQTAGFTQITGINDATLLLCQSHLYEIKVEIEE